MQFTNQQRKQTRRDDKAIKGCKQERVMRWATSNFPNLINHFAHVNPHIINDILYRQ